jgi:hypothetical protein
MKGALWMDLLDAINEPSFLVNGFVALSKTYNHVHPEIFTLTNVLNDSVIDQV